MASGKGSVSIYLIRTHLMFLNPYIEEEKELAYNLTAAPLYT